MASLREQMKELQKQQEILAKKINEEEKITKEKENTISRLEMLNQQIEAAEKALDTKLFSRQWIYDNIFDFSDDKKTEIYEGIVEDTKQKFRLTQIEDEGKDPAKEPQEPEPMRKRR